MAQPVLYVGVCSFREGGTCVSLHSEVLRDFQDEPLGGELEITLALAVLSFILVCDSLALWLEYWFPEGSDRFLFRFRLIQ